MNALDVDPVKIQNALWWLVKDTEVSDNIFIGNRPQSSELDDFVVVDTGNVRDLAGHARSICLIQLFAKDVDRKYNVTQEEMMQPLFYQHIKIPKL